MQDKSPDVAREGCVGVRVFFENSTACLFVCAMCLCLASLALVFGLGVLGVVMRLLVFSVWGGRVCRD